MAKDMSGGDSGGDSGRPPVDPRIARRRQDPIGRRLRQMYDEVVSENIPEDFLSFLEQADERRAGGTDNKRSETDDPSSESES